MMGITKHCGSVPRFTSSRRLAISAQREKSRFKRLGQNGREHCPCGFCAGTGWTRSAVIANRRDSRFTRTGKCCPFSKLDTFVQILVLRDVYFLGHRRAAPRFVSPLRVARQRGTQRRNKAALSVRAGNQDRRRSEGQKIR